jgi:hypothetical protein
MRETGVDDDNWSLAPMVRTGQPVRVEKPFEMTTQLYATCAQIQADVDRRADQLQDRKSRR